MVALLVVRLLLKSELIFVVPFNQENVCPPPTDSFKKEALSEEGAEEKLYETIENSLSKVRRQKFIGFGKSRQDA